MDLIIEKDRTCICVEPEAFEGVRRIAGTLAGDICSVTGSRPAIVSRLPEAGSVILCMTLGCSPAAEKYAARGLLDAAALQGKRECYQLKLAEEEGLSLLLICGSDKRGTIYGMFALSEYLGVSPLCFWGDASLVRRSAPVIGSDIQTISREPSVKYRGFFINDEWPCFGTWAYSHFGGINAGCYEKVFELLLRMKGNYLWPAMWSSSFPLDGPGSANEELADLYGVIMGYSHHEPCLRASEEWDQVRGPDSPYGNEWNYYTNSEGLLRYWEDSLRRSGGYENIITIGMRGERDTSMLGDDASLAENIELLKQIITAQRARIRELVPRKDPVQLLALYKEVEKYFCGDDETPGLRSWPELDDVLLMLCEDNFGHLRTVPPEDMRQHPGGWGMYYHLDYHGGPVSYEWVDSTPLTQVREQMSQAWEYGIRDLWIVNVGDLKLHEVALGYFLALAWDFDRWSVPEGPDNYMTCWAQQSFPGAGAGLQAEISRLYRDFVDMNSLRRPESLHPGIYHPVHYGETDRLLAAAEDLERRTGRITAALGPANRDAFFSMAGFPALASANLVKMHLYAGRNRHYADQGKVIANHYGRLAEACIEQDRALADRFAAFRDSRWSGMQLAPHIGFTRWNADDARYPVLCHVTPMSEPVMKVSRADSCQTAVKCYGPPMVIPVPDFLDTGCRQVTLEIANGGSVPFAFSIEGLPCWLRAEPAEGTVDELTPVTLTCLKDWLPADTARCELTLRGPETRISVDVEARRESTSGLPEGTFLPRRGHVVIPAAGWYEKQEAPGASFAELTHFGKYGSGLKLLPCSAASPAASSSLSYRFLVEEAGLHRVQLLTAPNNPVEIGAPVRFLISAGNTQQEVDLLPAGFRAGENSDARWCRDVLDQIHCAEAAVNFEPGVQTLTIAPLDPGIVLERIVISAPSAELLPSYLGPEPSVRVSRSDSAGKEIL